MGKHVESYYSHLIRTFLTHLARSLPQFHAPHIEADSSNNSSLNFRPNFSPKGERCQIFQLVQYLTREVTI